MMGRTRNQRTVADLGVQCLAGMVAVHVVFLITLFCMLLRDPSSSSIEGPIIEHALQTPAFWVASIVAFGGSFYLAR